MLSRKFFFSFSSAKVVGNDAVKISPEATLVYRVRIQEKKLSGTKITRTQSELELHSEFESLRGKKEN